MLAELDFVVGDICFGPQELEYTWHSIRYDKFKVPYIINSWVDHVLYHMNSKIINSVKIIRSGSNAGDHNCIRLILKSEQPLVNTGILKPKTHKLVMNWRSQPIIKAYSDKCEKELSKLDSIFENLDKMNPNSIIVKSKLTAANDLINDALVYSKKRIMNLYAYKKRCKNKFGIINKDWWDTTLKEYMNLMNECHNSYKSSNYDTKLKQPYIDAKKLFRCRKRYNIRLKRDHKLREIDKLFKLDHVKF